MHKIEANEIVGTTFYTIHRIGESVNGGNALMLYFAYIEQGRIQETNQSRSTDKFMMKKLKRGSSKLRKAKDVLKKLGLIDIIQVRNKLGQVETFYVKTNFLINEEKIRTQTLTYEIQTNNPEHSKSISGEQQTNTLSIKTKCLKNKNKLHQTEFDVVLSSFGLSIPEIEEWFRFSKSSKHIIDCISFIKECSAKLDITPIYNKDTINSTSTLINKGYSVDEIVRISEDDGRSDGCETYQEMIRNDYYLPAMY